MIEAFIIFGSIELYLVVVFIGLAGICFGFGTEINWGPWVGPGLWFRAEAWRPAYVDKRYVRMPLLPGLILVAAVKDEEFQVEAPRNPVV